MAASGVSLVEESAPAASAAGQALAVQAEPNEEAPEMSSEPAPAGPPAEQEAEELWKSIEDCALKYNLWGVADEAQFEDPIQTSKELDRALFIANCFREEGYEKVPDPNYFNRDVNLDAYIDENWELREDDPLVQTWQGCEEKLPEELKEEWDD